MMCFYKSIISKKTREVNCCFDLSDSEEMLNEPRRGSTVRPEVDALLIWQCHLVYTNSGNNGRKEI